jgi:glycosyltransferase involved in cell wall biosynthesis
MRERGLAQAARFSWRRVAEETLAVYEQVCG